MVGGIDLTGTVVSDDSGKFAPGSEVVVNSFGVGTDHWGGYCQQARMRPEWCLNLPQGNFEQNQSKDVFADKTTILISKPLFEPLFSISI